MEGSGYTRSVPAPSMLLVGASIVVGALTAQAQALNEGEALLRERVLPILRANCFECHGPAVKEVEGGLRMTGREAFLQGGDSGPAIAPGDRQESLLATAIGYEDAFLQMPPDGPLSSDDRAALLRWIELGAPWPSEATMDAGPAAEAAPRARPSPPSIEQGRTWWSFKPVVRPAVPAVAHPELAPTEIDAFVLARLEGRGLLPNEPATPYELVRRATYDLHGLPPTLEEVQAFLDDDQPGAYERLIDRLLASPRYAERWGRHWLDLVRYAQSNGYERDAEKPFAWRYRDWVLDAFDRDLPYDRFLVQQLAGDELPDAGEEGLVATGFYRLGVWDDEANDRETAVYDELDDVLRTISEGMLGVTLACARCHDHKFDPFPQEDYYSLLAYLRPLRPYEDARFAADSATLRTLDDSVLAAQTRENERASRREAIDQELEALDEIGRARIAASAPPGAPEPSLAEIGRALDRADRKRAKDLRRERLTLEGDSFQGSTAWILCAREGAGAPPETRVLVRGDAAAPAELVEPHPPRVLGPLDAAPPPVVPPPDGGSSGRRLALAGWIASPQNPLTARAIVNRVWQFHFGAGLSPTPNDLGHAGLPPTHPELLDWLAATFIEEDGWSLKALHKRIMLSNAYRASSRAAGAALAADEADELLWRQRPRRLSAEEVHDASLYASGELRLPAGLDGGRGFFPPLSREALAGSSRPGFGWEFSPPQDCARRAVYSFVKRTQPVPLFEAFDAPSLTLPVGTRGSTTTATQALTLLNGAFSNERAAALAARVAEETGDDDAARVRRAYERVLARPPGPEEARLAREYLARETAAFAGSDPALAVRFDVPERVDAVFLTKLAGADLLLGPRDGWRYLKGRWSNPYNGTLGPDQLRGPALLRQGLEVEDGEVRARVEVRPGGSLGLLVRAGTNDVEEPTGLELRLDRDAGRARFLQHDAEESRVLAEFPVSLVGPVELRFSFAGPALALAIDGAPAGAAEAAGGAPGGAFGLSALGEGGQLEHLTVLRRSSGSDDLAAAAPLGPDDPGPPRQRALEALCLALLNLNAFLYVD